MVKYFDWVMMPEVVWFRFTTFVHFYSNDPISTIFVMVASAEEEESSGKMD
jgi:hypothetical protein